MNNSLFGVVLAGGSGTRMGNMERPKQFLELAGKPIIIHTMEKMLAHSEFDKVLVLCPQAWVSHMKDLVKKQISFQDMVEVLEGGSTRNETIMNAIRFVEKTWGITEDTAFVTHDAVRPFVSHRIIKENIEHVCNYDACDTVIPATDTIVESQDGNTISEIPDRAKMYQGQTPQSFKVLKFKENYNSLTDKEKDVLTDACKIMVMKGNKVHLILGDVENIKITHPADLRFAEALIGAFDAE